MRCDLSGRYRETADEVIAGVDVARSPDLLERLVATV
jgi:hypothetical protein